MTQSPVTQTANLDLPLLSAAQAQKHVTHNEALLTLDALTQLAVVGTASAPPAVLTEGARYIVAGPASGEFVGRERQIAWRVDGAWRFLAPQTGWRAYSEEEGALLVFDGSLWRRLDAFLPALGVNATAETGRRFVVSSASAALTYEQASSSGGSTRFIVNKAAAGDAASVLFQSGWSGRAEIGLTGSNAFSVRTSTDGANWTTRIAVDPANGNVGVGRDIPAARLDIASGSNQGLRLSANKNASMLSCFDSGADGVLDIDLAPFSNASAATVRFFRTASTTNLACVQVLRANGGFAANCQLAGNGDSYFGIYSGNVGVGVSSPQHKLSVAGVTAPTVDNAYSLGAAQRRWSDVFVASGVVSGSDARLKTAVRDCPLGLDFVLALRPRMFRWIEGRAATGAEDPALPGKRNHLGFLAQEVRATLDAAGLDCGLWTLADPTDPESGQSLRYEQFFAPLARAVQELAARLARLETAA